MQVDSLQVAVSETGPPVAQAGLELGSACLRPPLSTGTAVKAATSGWNRISIVYTVDLWEDQSLGFQISCSPSLLKLLRMGIATPKDW